jgi:chromosome segregation ATPase
MLNAYKALANAEDVLSQVIQHESNLKVLTKAKADLVAGNATLKSEQDRLKISVADLMGRVNAAQQALNAALSEKKDVQQTLQAEQNAQAETLKAQRDAHQRELQKITETQQRAAQEARDDLARAQQELAKAKERLAQFHSGVTSLAR